MSDAGESTDRDGFDEAASEAPVAETAAATPVTADEVAPEAEPAAPEVEQAAAPEAEPVAPEAVAATPVTEQPMPAAEPAAPMSEPSAPEVAEPAAPEAAVPAQGVSGPQTEVAELPAIVVAPEPGRSLADRLPFWILGGVWVAFVATLVYLLWPESAGVFVTSQLYPVLVFGGAGLVVVGFVTGLVTWLFARGRASKDERGHIARAVWIRAMTWTAGGVALWWIGLIVLDLHRSGLIR